MYLYWLRDSEASVHGHLCLCFGLLWGRALQQWGYDGELSSHHGSPEHMKKEHFWGPARPRNSAHLVARFPSSLGWCPEQTLGMNSIASPTTPRGSSTPRHSNMPWIIGSEVRRTKHLPPHQEELEQAGSREPGTPTNQWYGFLPVWDLNTTS